MFNVYMQDHIILKRGTYNQWGTLTNTSNVAVKGRFNFKTKLVRNLQGEQVVATAEVMIPNIPVEHKDRIVYKNIEYSIINITTERNFSEKYVKLYIS